MASSHPSHANDPPGEPAPAEDKGTARYDWRFKSIMFSLSLTSILAGLEIGCIPTAMPSMVEDVGSRDTSHTAAVWVANAYFLTMTALQPLYGQTANIFGRRTMIMLAVLLFSVGSVICGPATSLEMLIAGRAVMGAGGGGILVMVEIIICDLCPQRDRPKYLGIVMSLFGVFLSLGPLIGGALAEHASWRWIFWLNLPAAAVAVVPLALLLKVRYDKAPLADMMQRVDWSGNAIFAASVTSILLSLTWGGTEHAWSAWQTLVPLILGLVGLGAFLILESSKFVPAPTMPLRLFENWTSAGSFALTFVASVLTYWISYYLPVYFQAVLEASPTRSGINLLPSSILCIPFSMAVGGGVSRLGRYRPFQFAGIVLLTLGSGILAVLDVDSSTGHWVGFQVIIAAGIGIMLTCTLPAVQAPLPEADVAVATATWGFLRSFGGVWGVAVPTAIFNSNVNKLLDQGRLVDSALASLLRDGGAYALAATGFVSELSEDNKRQVKGVYVDSLRLVWLVSIAFGALGFLSALLVKEVGLKEDLQTEFGLEKDRGRPGVGKAATPGVVEAGNTERGRDREQQGVASEEAAQQGSI